MKIYSTGESFAVSVNLKMSSDKIYQNTDGSYPVLKKLYLIRSLASGEKQWKGGKDIKKFNNFATFLSDHLNEK